MLKSNGGNFPTYQNSTVITQIMSIEEPRNRHLAEAVVATAASLELPVPVPKENDPVMLSLMSSLLHLMNQHPERFNELPGGDTPIGCEFRIGHSLEDWFRALVSWQAFTRQRHDKQNKYSFKGTLRNKIELTLDFAETAQITRQRLRADMHQDPTLSLSRREPPLPLGVTISSQVHRMAYFASVRATNIDNSLMPVTLAVRIDPYRLGVINQAHVTAIHVLMTAVNPAVTAEKYDRNPMRAMTPAEMRNLVEFTYAVTARHRHGEPQVVSKTDPNQHAGSEINLRLGFIGAFLPIDEEQGEDTDSPALHFKHVTFALHGKLAERYCLLSGSLEPGYYIARPGELLSTDPRPEVDRLTDTILCLAAVDLNNIVALSAKPHNAALPLAVKDMKHSIDEGVPYLECDDLGASYIYSHSKRDDRCGTPTSCLAMARFLLAESPVLALVVREITEAALMLERVTDAKSGVTDQTQVRFTVFSEEQWVIL